MVRIEGVSEENAKLWVKLVYWLTRRRLKTVPRTFKVSALSPWVLGGVTLFRLCFERFRLVDPKLLALAELKAALLIGCPFCVDIISALSKAKGVTDEQRRDLMRYQESGSFSPLERLVIEYAAQISTTPVDVPDALYKELQRHFDPPQLVELTAAIAWENYRARFNHALGMESEGFARRAACEVPLSQAGQAGRAASRPRVP
jgi:alkylhydroperoxidase family enzyme